MKEGIIPFIATESPLLELLKKFGVPFTIKLWALASNLACAVICTIPVIKSVLVVKLNNCFIILN